MALNVDAVRKVKVLSYKGHSFYEDILNEDVPWTHVDNRGREINSNCYSEEEAMDYVNSIERQ